jgi:type I restriction enzyme S subunit
MKTWKTQKLGAIADMCLGKMLDKEKNKGEPQPYLGNINVRWGGFDFSNLNEMRFEESESERYGLKPGDLVVCEGGEPGRCALWRGAVPNMKIQKALHRVRVQSGYDTEFLYYRFLLAGKTGGLEKHFIGSTIKHLTGFGLKEVEFAFPPELTQKRIASVLSALDAKIELNNAINAELEGMAKLLYDYWFVQFDFPLTAAQAASLGRPELAGHPYKSSGGPMVHNPTLNRPIPAGWSAGTLDNLGEVVGGTTPSKENDAYYCTNGIPWITPKDLSNNKGNKFIDRGEIDVTEAGKKESSLKLMPAGTVLLSSRAPIGYTAIATNELTTNQGFKSFVPNRGYGTDFIYQTLNHFMKLIEQNASGSTFKEISGGTLKAIKIPLPSIELAKLYTDKVAPITGQQQNLEKQNQELTALRDWLLPMLMNGQVTVG